MLPLTLLSLALATITRAAEVSIDTQKITAGDKVKVTIENATETGSGYQSYKVDKMRIGLYNSIYNAYMCKCSRGSMLYYKNLRERGGLMVSIRLPNRPPRRKRRPIRSHDSKRCRSVGRILSGPPPRVRLQR